MQASGVYYKSSGPVPLKGVLKAGLLTIIISFLLSWGFVWAKYSVTLDWLQLLFLFIFAFTLAILHRGAVRFGKFQNRLFAVLWSVFTVACGTYASWIIRVAKLHPEHPLVILPSSVWSGMQEAFSNGIPFYISFSRVLERGMHVETDPVSTVLIELGVLLAVVTVGSYFTAQEEFFCSECHHFLDPEVERGDLNMPSDWSALQKSLEGGDSTGLLELYKAPEDPVRLKLAVFRCRSNTHPGIIRITELNRKHDRARNRDYDKDKVLIKGIYLDSDQCKTLGGYLKSLKK
ncbi:MAG: hypothetical protein JEY99_04490 [Spirochaetales bacterium]|nr:hypothetical protein [Spirochaetales bacterium]